MNYTVIAVSSNTNSFGYKEVLLLNEEGKGWATLVQAYVPDPVPSPGDEVSLQDPRLFTTRPLPPASAATAKRVIAEARGLQPQP